MQRCWQLLLLICLTASTALAARPPKTQALLVLSAETVKPGDTVTAALVLTMPPKWHTYWRNSGDSGGPTEIKWKLPAGITAGNIQWPVPERDTDPAVGVTYVYHDAVMLLVPLQVGTATVSGLKEISADVSWLECAEECFLAKASVQASFSVGTEIKPSPAAEDIAAAQKKIPTTNPALQPQAWWEAAPDAKKGILILEWTAAQDGKAADFYNYGGGGYDMETKVEVLPSVAGKVRLRKTVIKTEGDYPKEISGLAVENVPAGMEAVAAEITVPIAAKPPEGVAPVTSSTTTGGGPAAGGNWFFWLQMFGSAFLGGLILNIMPCVLPVIALKILGFVQQSHSSPGAMRRLGLTYGVGVLVSFLILAGVVIAAQAAGHKAGWGGQFQNLSFVVCMTILILLVALNFFGVFEVNLGGKIMGTAGDLSAKNGYAGAFFNGVLATVLATPCVAPFLGVALTFAIAQPPLVILLIFLTIGLGLAFPYVVLSWRPDWLQFLPKPGLWMVRFKIAMGFPMLITAFWLYTVAVPNLVKQDESDDFWFGVFLVAVAAAAWIYGEFVQRGTKRRGVAAICCLLLVSVVGAATLHKEPKVRWEPWSQAAVDKARAEGHPVFVDFTARWCPNCQVNKRTSILREEVLKKMTDLKVVTLKADYSNYDEQITKELERFQRSAIPLNVVFPRDPQAAPIVLPPILTPGLVMEALDKAAK